MLVADETTPRSRWPLARVNRCTKPSMPGITSIKVKIKTTVLERPVAKRVLLEATEENEH